MPYFKVREVIANDTGNVDESAVGRTDTAIADYWLQQEASESDLATKEENNLLGHWAYDGDRGVFIIDKTSASFIGIEDYHQPVTAEQIIACLSSFDASRFHLNMNEDSMGDIIYEHSTMSQGPCKGKSFIVQGSVLRRREDGTALYAVGFISHENSPHSELIPRELSGDGMYIWDSTTDELVCSASYHAMIGYKEEEFPHYLEDFVLRIVHPDDNDFFMVLSQMCLTDQYGDYFESCMRIRHKDGHYIWTICRGLVQERDATGKARRVIGTQTNINLVQSCFDNIKLMMFTDSLTGLHNRNYFMQNYRRYEELAVQPVSVIFIDISGLKLTNDILGHSHGDYLLIKARDLIREGIAASSYDPCVAQEAICAVHFAKAPAHLSKSSKTPNLAAAASAQPSANISQAANAAHSAKAALNPNGAKAPADTNSAKAAIVTNGAMSASTSQDTSTCPDEATATSESAGSLCYATTGTSNATPNDTASQNSTAASQSSNAAVRCDTASHEQEATAGTEASSLDTSETNTSTTASSNTSGAHTDTNVTWPTDKNYCDVLSMHHGAAATPNLASLALDNYDPNSFDIAQTNAAANAVLAAASGARVSGSSAAKALAASALAAKAPIAANEYHPLRASTSSNGAATLSASTDAIQGASTNTKAAKVNTLDMMSKTHDATQSHIPSSSVDEVKARSSDKLDTIDQHSDLMEIMRLAGDEFLVILPCCSDYQVKEIAQNIDRLREENNTYHEEHTDLEHRPVPIFFGIGHATYYGDQTPEVTLKHVINQADELMQIDKDNRRADFYDQLKRFFELKKGRPVSMRDERRVTILSEEEREQLRQRRINNLLF